MALDFNALASQSVEIEPTAMVRRGRGSAPNPFVDRFEELLKTGKAQETPMVSNVPAEGETDSELVTLTKMIQSAGQTFRKNHAHEGEVKPSTVKVISTDGKTGKVQYRARWVTKFDTVKAENATPKENASGETAKPVTAVPSPASTRPSPTPRNDETVSKRAR